LTSKQKQKLEKMYKLYSFVIVHCGLYAVLSTWHRIELSSVCKLWGYFASLSKSMYCSARRVCAWRLLEQTPS